MSGAVAIVTGASRGIGRDSLASFGTHGPASAATPSSNTPPLALSFGRRQRVRPYRRQP